MYNLLTNREREVFNCIVYNGLSKPEIAKRLTLKVTTINTHINSICNKLGYEGDTRLLQLVIDHYIRVFKGVERMKNCTECKFFIDDKCQCTLSEYYEESVNEYMICREFEEEQQ